MAAPRSSRPANFVHESKSDTRYERRMAEILGHATDVFYDKGYEGASMRDLSRATSLSLAGLYYYFESKEKLLYLIQKHTFETILRQLENRLQGITDSEQGVRAFIANHLEYFLANQKAMTVLSHEDEVLKGQYGEEISQIKRQYYRTCRGLVDALKTDRGVDADSRVAVLSLFGMMNWIYTWHRPRVDVDAGELARQMSNIFLRGILGNATRQRAAERARSTDAGPERETKPGMAQKAAARKRKTASSTI